MKERIKKIMKIALLVIIAIVILYNLVFDTSIMTREEELKFREKYDEIVLFSSRHPMRYLEKICPPAAIVFYSLSDDTGLDLGNRYVVFFRWRKSELKKQLESEIIRDLEKFKQSEYIKDYTYDKVTMQLDIFMDTDKYWGETCHYIEYEWQNDNLQTLRALRGISTYLKTHEVRSNVEEPEIETKEYVYDEQEIDLLNKIISRSLNKTPFDIRNEDKIKGDSEDETGGHICYLDLSDYNYITGKLDLSGFSKLQYVLLRGMKISEVVLPESLEYIDERSFAYCEKLEKIVIPKNVKSLENPVFYGCENLKEIVFEGNAPEVSLDNEDVFGKVPEDLIIYRKKSAKGWQEKCWDKYDVRIIDE